MKHLLKKIFKFSLTYFIIIDVNFGSFPSIIWKMGKVKPTDLDKQCNIKMADND